MNRGHFAIITCPDRGHERKVSLGELAPEWLNDPPWTIRDGVLAKMRCERCGGRGRPGCRFGWMAYAE